MAVIKGKYSQDPRNRNQCRSHRLEKLDAVLAGAYDEPVGGKTFRRTYSRILRSLARTGEIASFSRKIRTVRSCSLFSVSTLTSELRYGWLEVYVAYKTSIFPHCLSSLSVE